MLWWTQAKIFRSVFSDLFDYWVSIEIPTSARHYAVVKLSLINLEMFGLQNLHLEVETIQYLTVRFWNVILKCMYQKLTAVLHLLIQFLLRKQEICLSSKSLQGKIKYLAYKMVSLIDSSLTCLDLIYCSAFRSNCLQTLNIFIEKGRLQICLIIWLL